MPYHQEYNLEPTGCLKQHSRACSGTTHKVPLSTTPTMSAMPMPAATENMVLLKPTLHVEVIVKKQKQSTEPVDLQELRRDLHQWIINCHATVKLGQEIVLDGERPARIESAPSRPANVDQEMNLAWNLSNA